MPGIATKKKPLAALTLACLLGVLGIVSAQAPGRFAVANAGSVGTTLNKVAKLTGAPSTAVLATATDTNGFVGITVAGAGTTGNAVIQFSGLASCVFDGATTAGHFVEASRSVDGDCTDAGSSYPAGGQVLGKVLTTNGSGGTYTIFLAPFVFPGPPVNPTLVLVHINVCGAGTNTAYTCTITATTAGNAIDVVSANNQSGLPVTSVTCGSDTLTNQAGANAQAAGPGSITQWTVLSGVGGVTSCTVNSSTGANYYVVYEISGVTGLDTIPATTSGSGTPQLSPTITATSFPELFIAHLGPSGSATGIHSGNVFTSDSLADGYGFAHYLSTATGTFGASWDSSGNYISNIIGFK